MITIRQEIYLWLLCTSQGDFALIEKRKKQTTVAISIVEAKYHAMATTTCEIT